MTVRLNWPNGDGDQWIDIPIINDGNVEPDETFTVTLTGANGASLGSPSSTTVLIVNDDVPPTVRFVAGAYSLVEHEEHVLLTARRLGDSSGEIRVDYRTFDGSAIAGQDFTFKSGTLIWPDEDTSDKTIDVVINDDNTQELDETFTVAFTDAAGGVALGTPDVATVTIRNDEVGPTIHLTSGSGGVVTRPIIQVQGYSETELRSISYTLRTNGVVAETGEGHITKQEYDEDTGQNTRSWFQVYDLELVPGGNQVSIQFANLQGFTTTMDLNYTLDYSGVTTGPAILRQWPPNGTSIAGTQFTLRGYLDDPTAEIRAMITHADGTSTEIQGEVERDGLYWVDDLPLGEGNNSVAVTMVNAAGRSSVQTFSVQKSPVQITINPGFDLREKFTSVSGSINSADYTVWVNGVRATMNANLTWTATGVPLNEGGTATVEATAIPNTDNGGNGTGAGGTQDNVASPNPSGSPVRTDPEKPARIRVSSYSATESKIPDPRPANDPCSGRVNWTATTDWIEDVGGLSRFDEVWEACVGDAPGMLVGGTYVQETKWDAAENALYRISNDSEPWIGWAPFEDWESTIPFALVIGAVPVPKWPWYHRDVTSHQHTAIGTYFETHSIRDDTRIELLTGGRALSKRQSLFVLTASATRFIDNVPPQTVPPQEIQIAGKSVGSDGKLYLVLPDNSTKHLTPKISGNYYTYRVTATKHKVALVANGTPLNPQYVRPGATYCVGKGVAFSYVFYPPVDGAVSYSQQWAFTGPYRNAYEKTFKGDEFTPIFRTRTTCYPRLSWSVSGAHSEDDPVVYLIDDSMLNRASTGAWWIDEGKKTALCSITVNSASGGSAQLTVPGKFQIYRPPMPAIQNINIAGPRRFTIQAAGLYFLLRLGGDGTAADNMNYNVVVSSAFAGNAILTQIASVDYSSPGPQFIDWRDGNEIYEETRVTPGFSSAIPFHDGPQNSGPLPVRLKASFLQYIRFRPDTSDGIESIYATIGRLYWRINAVASDNGINPAETPDPVPLDRSFEFPFWTGVYPQPPEE